MKPAPYPADTRAKGWRFELDLERVKQSDTWAIAAPEARPWLFMLWAESWLQTPCGSLPDDDELLCARIGMPGKMFAKHRAALMRGWWRADDGRLYHPTITELVVSMLKRKDAEKTRKAEYRARMEAERGRDAPSVPPMSRGTDAGRDGDGRGIDATGTGTGLEDYGPNGPPSSRAGEPTPAAAVCLALKAAGIGNVNPGHMRLTTLLAAGATVAEFVAHAASAADKSDPFAYVLGAVEGERKRAAVTAPLLRRGPMPNRQQALEERNLAVAQAWASGGGA